MAQRVGGSADCHTMFAKRESRYNYQAEVEHTLWIVSHGTPCVSGRYTPASSFGRGSKTLRVVSSMMRVCRQYHEKHRRRTDASKNDVED